MSNGREPTLDASTSIAISVISMSRGGDGGMRGLGAINGGGGGRGADASCTVIGWIACTVTPSCWESEVRSRSRRVERIVAAAFALDAAISAVTEIEAGEIRSVIAEAEIPRPFASAWMYCCCTLELNHSTVAETVIVNVTMRCTDGLATTGGGGGGGDGFGACVLELGPFALPLLDRGGEGGGGDCC